MVVTQIWQSLYYGFYLYELAVLKMKICQKSQTCLNITQIFIQGISIHSQALGIFHSLFPKALSFNLFLVLCLFLSDCGCAFICFSLLSDLWISDSQTWHY